MPSNHAALTRLTIKMSDEPDTGAGTVHEALRGGNNTNKGTYALVPEKKIVKIGVVCRPDYENAITAIYFFDKANNAL